MSNYTLLGRLLEYPKMLGLPLNLESDSLRSSYGAGVGLILILVLALALAPLASPFDWPR